ncbi:hypothetical protein WT49_10210 [Burkholderia territorii]|nr:hypothetical protein WT49_10210 [Burkholderia territorii]KWE41436.1 hypothetical protein WT50_15175 [Burkholderia territorii]KWE41748.1 hypothetical protein WT51_25260 [Burkholderia territorii]
MIGTIAVLCGIAPWMAHATGVLPDTPLLVVSESEGTAQMGLKNTDDQPLLLFTTIKDLPGQKGPELYAIPPVIRVEPGARQVVRFFLQKGAQPLSVQELKRVYFEGVPPEAKGKAATESKVRLTVRQDIPVVISPRGLEQDPQPWKKLQWSTDGKDIVVTNPSPFVVRLSQSVDLLPTGGRAVAFAKTYILPGEKITLKLPPKVKVSEVRGVRLFPASPFGFDVGKYDVELSAGAPLVVTEPTVGASQAGVAVPAM